MAGCASPSLSSSENTLTPFGSQAGSRSAKTPAVRKADPAKDAWQSNSCCRKGWRPRRRRLPHPVRQRQRMKSRVEHATPRSRGSLRPRPRQSRSKPRHGEVSRLGSPSPGPAFRGADSLSQSAQTRLASRAASSGTMGSSEKKTHQRRRNFEQPGHGQCSQSPRRGQQAEGPGASEAGPDQEKVAGHQRPEQSGACEPQQASAV